MVAGGRPLVSVSALPLGQRRELLGPRLRTRFANTSRHRQRLTDRGPAVAGGPQLAQELEIQLRIIETRDTRTAANGRIGHAISSRGNYSPVPRTAWAAARIWGVTSIT